VKTWLLVLMLIGWSPVAVAQIEVSLPDVEGDPGESVVIPVVVSDITGRNVKGFWFKLLFDPEVMEIDSVDLTGSLSEGSLVATNARTAGEFVVASANARALSGSGPLIYMTATLISQGASTLQFDDFLFNDGSPDAALFSGLVRSGTVTSAEDERPSTTFKLHGHYPEPATDTVSIQVDLALPGPLQLRVFDMLGREVAATGFMKDAGAGQDVFLDVGDLSAGKYIYSVTAGPSTATGLLTVSR